MSLTRGIGSIPTSCFLILMRARMSARFTWDPSVFGYTIGAEGDDLTFDERDSAPYVPKSGSSTRISTGEAKFEPALTPWDQHHHL